MFKAFFSNRVDSRPWMSRVWAVVWGPICPLQTTETIFWLVVEPTHLKNIIQIGNLPQIGMNIKKHLKPPPSCVATTVCVFCCQSLTNMTIMTSPNKANFQLTTLSNRILGVNNTTTTGKCLTPTQLLICSSFSRENVHLLLICSSLSTTQTTTKRTIWVTGFTTNFETKATIGWLQPPHLKRRTPPHRTAFFC